jgi:hypothetical protein
MDFEIPDGDESHQQQKEVPTPAALDEFRNQVRIWLELDGSIKLLQQLTKERRLFKQQLTDKILLFMMRFNISDLVTKEGRLVQRTSYVKRPLSHTMIRQRIESQLTSSQVPVEQCTAITTAVFNRDRSERNSLCLRKIKIS